MILRRVESNPFRHLIIQMSQTKQPKPFLKRGTRQFLSNATVRSLNQKPNIVDFGADEEQPIAIEKPWKKSGGAVKKEEEIKIDIKVREKPKENKPTPSSSDQRRAKENKVQNEEKATPASNNSGKKKPALLEDYLGAPPKKEVTRSSYSKDKNPPPKVTTMAAMLRRQDEEDQVSDQSDELPNYKVIAHQPVKAPPTVVNSRKLPPAKVEDEQAVEVNFQSDSEEEEKPKPTNNFKQPLKMQQPTKPVFKPAANTWDEEDEEQPNEDQNRGPSKILQKYYKKEVEALPSKSHHLSQPKKMTVADIPNELKEQLFNEFVMEKGAEIQKKLGELEGAIGKRKKEQQKFEQENKRLTKEREQFLKEMEEKNKEFEEKIKNENSKLTREKRYMKDVQTTGKADWKTKNEVEQLRVKLDQAENEKKKIKTELTREIDRLRKKLDEETAEKDSLKGQIRCLELEKIRSKQQTKEPQNTQVAVQNSRQLQVSRNEAIPKLGYWWDAPKTSFTSAFFDDSFTLISLQAHMYKLDALQHYQYYLEKKDEFSQLVNETQDESGTKLTRTYRNGKMELEYVSRVLRQNFPPPFKFTVVQHLNGDIKLILPEGIHVYYDRNKQVTQFRITPAKMIHHFHRLGQVEMKFTHPRLGTIHELYSGSTLVRKVNGDEEKWKRSERGVVKV